MLYLYFIVISLKVLVILNKLQEYSWEGRRKWVALWQSSPYFGEERRIVTLVSWNTVVETIIQYHIFPTVYTSLCCSHTGHVYGRSHAWNQGIKCALASVTITIIWTSWFCPDSGTLKFRQNVKNVILFKLVYFKRCLTDSICFRWFLSAYSSWASSLGHNEHCHWQDKLWLPFSYHLLQLSCALQ